MNSKTYLRRTQLLFQYDRWDIAQKALYIGEPKCGHKGESAKYPNLRNPYKNKCPGRYHGSVQTDSLTLYKENVESINYLRQIRRWC